jgi:type III pantothenate kinase
MNLLIDIGNSRLKWASLEHFLSKQTSISYNANNLLSKLDKIWIDLPTPHKIWVSNVAGQIVKKILIEWISLHWHIHINFIVSEKQAYGVSNAYLKPEILGVDRWLALIATKKLNLGITIIVDCGTAVTLDVINHNGKHLGGVISSGINTMYNSLLKNTQNIILNQHELSENNKTKKLLAKDTTNAVKLGAIYSIVGLIEKIKIELSKQWQQPIFCIITGGDGNIIKPLLSFDSKYIHDLVLKGIVVVASENP